MRIQTQIITAILCINAAMAMADYMSGYGLVPTGSAQANATSQVVYGNATGAMQNWTTAAKSSGITSVFGWIGDILNSLPMFFKVLIDVFVGLPTLLPRLAARFSLDSTSWIAVDAISVALTAVLGWAFFTYIIELLTGRDLFG